MAALAGGQIIGGVHSFQTRSSSSSSSRTSIAVVLCCQRPKPNPSDPDPPELIAKKREQKKSEGVLKSVEKMGEELKEKLRPQRKGDWKDVTLMSISFALYVYISQKIVCAYCVWMAMPNQQW